MDDNIAIEHYQLTIAITLLTQPFALADTEIKVNIRNELIKKLSLKIDMKMAVNVKLPIRPSSSFT